MLQNLRVIIGQTVAQTLGVAAAATEERLEPPKRDGHGHLAWPVFSWAKEKAVPPPQLAAEWAARLQAAARPELAKVEAAGGFINFTFRSDFVQKVLLREVFARVGQVGHGTLGEGKKLLIDFSSPNVAKPMHVGHLRATMIGQAIVNLAKAQGYQVIGLNHLGDWGVQFGKLAWAYMHWGHEYPFAEQPFSSLYKLYVRFHEEAERNPALEQEGAKVFKRLEEGDAKIREIWQHFVSISLTDYQRIWDQLGVKHDLVRGESFYNERLRPVEDELERKGLLVESDGAMVVRLDEEQMPPCLIRKSDGASLYATRDLASAIYRMEELKSDLNLYVVGVDQTLHFRQVFKVLEKMGYPWTSHCHHISFGMYRFKEGKISTRKGTAIFLEDVLQKAIELAREIVRQKNPDLPEAEKVARQVGIGAVVFNDLVNDRVKDVEFDWDRALDFEGDSGPYVQYCGVRCASLMRRYGRSVAHSFAVELNAPEEQELMRALLAYGDALQSACRSFKPHIVAGQLIEICHRFGQFYNKCRILGESPDIESSRMTLVALVHQVLREGLSVLGMELPEAM